MFCCIGLHFGISLFVFIFILFSLACLYILLIINMEYIFSRFSIKNYDIICAKIAFCCKNVH